jgi:tRNA nucleotidyltransferase/poly(A) polymerase
MHNQLLQQLASFCASRGINAWLVGGTPRDFLLGRPVSDLDLAVDVDGVALARSLADILGGSFVLLDSERGTGRVVLPASADSATLVIDLVQLRAATIEADLALRDVTINALAWPLRDDGELPIADLIDPLGGATDLAGRRLRACGPTSISDDPLRIMRVVRLAAVLGFVVTPELDVLLRASAGALTSVAAERVRDELLKLLTTPVAGSWLRYLDQIGVLTTLIPRTRTGPQLRPTPCAFSACAGPFAGNRGGA